MCYKDNGVICYEIKFIVYGKIVIKSGIKILKKS